MIAVSEGSDLIRSFHVTNLAQLELRNKIQEVNPSSKVELKIREDDPSISQLTVDTEKRGRMPTIEITPGFDREYILLCKHTLVREATCFSCNHIEVIR